MIKKASIIIILFFYSCGNKTENKIAVPHSKESKLKKDIIKKPKNSIHIDTMNFVAYNDDGDYFILNAKKDKGDFRFINDNNEDRSLLKGDIVEIKWKNDTIYIAGDGETPELAESIVSVKKIKDGNVSTFRKKYNLQLKYHWSEENDYSTSYLDKLYEVVEYYIANSKNERINYAIAKKEQLEYSIEEETRDGQDYTVIGISIVFEHRVNTLQWLYYKHGDLNTLYAYDLPNDKLIKFD
ncbi:hypothetical protein HNQ02_003298 [Flavobacterium sp. 7E]|uniref:hypothetical protein n=1 Tax=Flavobacterium sp. 7E TaxID=2735898 RepID=UPI00156E3C3A|nr:hypothetical protein [Flavobacterium sp. 7E]NRS90358.1 hypothetical protein [Flavobacterium sp. 7E]